MAFQPALKINAAKPKKKKNRPPQGVQVRLVPGSVSQHPFLRIRISPKAISLANIKPKDKAAIEFDPATHRVAICRSTNGHALRPYGYSGSFAVVVAQSRLDESFLADLKTADLRLDKHFSSPEKGMLVVNLTEDAQ